MWGEHYATTLFNSSYFTVDDTIHFLKKVCYKFKEKNIEPSWFHGPSHEFFFKVEYKFKEKNIKPGWVHGLSHGFNELIHNNRTIIFFLYIFLLVSFIYIY
jgi:hypothetical protein